MWRQLPCLWLFFSVLLVISERSAALECNAGYKMEKTLKNGTALKNAGTNGLFGAGMLKQLQYQQFVLYVRVYQSVAKFRFHVIYVMSMCVQCFAQNSWFL